LLNSNASSKSIQDPVNGADHRFQDRLRFFIKNSTIPIVFCGINRDVSDYGFPCSNITGMILLDVRMPGGDGFKNWDRSKAEQSTKEIPVIFMTA